MKIRTGFVTNSSSTNFLLIAKTELTKQKFLKLLGCDENSPISEILNPFYDLLLEKSERYEDDFVEIKQISEESIGSYLRNQHIRLSERMLEKVIEANKNGYHILYGKLESDYEELERYFLSESIEEENEDLYFNGIESIF